LWVGAGFCKEVKGVTASCCLPPGSTLLLFSGGSLLPLFGGGVRLLDPFFTLGFLLLEPGGLPGPRFTGPVGVFSSFFFGAERLESSMSLSSIFWMFWMSFWIARLIGLPSTFRFLVGLTGKGWDDSLMTCPSIT